MNEIRYVFGYGSIVNPASAAKDINLKHFIKWVTLEGYERVFDAPVEGFLCLNLKKSPGKTVEGMLFEAKADTFKAFERREKGYTATDISESVVTDNLLQPVFAFTMPNATYPTLTIEQSYFDTCIQGIPPSLRAKWLTETVINNSIIKK